MADTLTIPTSATELEEMIGDSATLQRIMAEGNLGTFITNYARTVYDRDMSIAAQVTEQVQTITAQWLREQGERDRESGAARLNMAYPADHFWSTPSNIAQAARRAGAFNPSAMGSKIDEEYRGQGGASRFFRDIWDKTERTAPVQARLDKIRNAFSSTVPSEGGFLIPEVLRSEILATSLETAVVRPRARVIPMDSLRVPFPAIDATSNVSSVYGGIVAYWTEEGAALTDSSASFGRVVLDAKKLTAYTAVPNELLADSLPSFEAFIGSVFPEALSFYEDIAFMTGTGVGMPLGMLGTQVQGSSLMISVAKEAGQLAATIVWENIVKMYARMLPSSLGRAVWVASIDTFPELATMALSVGTGGSAIWLNNGQVGPPMTILGRPVIFTEKAPAVLGTQGDISFVDWGFYLIGDRQVMSAMSSPHYKFGNDQTAYRIIERVDGRPWLNSAITPQNNGPTLSPVVQLATR